MVHDFVYVPFIHGVNVNSFANNKHHKMSFLQSHINKSEETKKKYLQIYTSGN